MADKYSGNDFDLTDIKDLLSGGGADMSDEEFTLESVLAEFKGLAYINGDKKTPAEVLNNKTDEIINEVTGKIIFPDKKDVPLTAEKNAVKAEPIAWEGINKPVSAPEITGKEPETAKEKTPEKILRPDFSQAQEQSEPAAGADVKEIKDTGKAFEKQETVNEEAPYVAEDKIEDFDLRFFESFAFADSDYKESRKGDFEEVNEAEDITEDDGISRVFAAGKKKEKKAKIYKIIEEPEEEEPDIAAEVERVSAPLRSMPLRLLTSALLFIVMAVMTFLAESGIKLPFGLGTDISLISHVLLIMQLVVMFLGLDVLISGFSDIAKGEMSAESLVAVSCLMTTVDTFMLIIKNDFSYGLPFSAVAAGAIVFTLKGRRSYWQAMRTSLKMSAAVSSPYGVILERGGLEGRSILKKLQGKTDGFYSKLTQADIGETTYALAAPMMFIAALVFAFLASVGKGRGESFAHCFAVILSVAAAFPAAAVFAVPFYFVATKAKRVGSAVAGWGGACDMYDSDGAIITDEDIFPVGTVSLSGIKLFEGMPQKKAIIYTASLIIESGSGLSKTFSDLLRGQGLRTARIDDFSCYEGGGLGALINGEHVLVGSGAFMNLMGIRVPESMNTKNTVFTALNEELAAAFSVNYIPANSVQSALVSMLDTRMNMLLAVRDFNVTPNMIQQKFKVSMEGVELIPIEDSYKISAESVPKDFRASAVLCREGLAPFAEAITRGKRLKQIATVNTVMSIAGSVVGMLLMFFLCWSGAFASACAGNVLIFALALDMCVELLSQIVKR